MLLLPNCGIISKPKLKETKREEEHIWLRYSLLGACWWWNATGLLPSICLCVCVSVSAGGKKSGGGGRRCQTVGMEDDQHPGKLRKYKCCPVSSSKKSSSKKLVKGVAFIGGDEDDCDQDDYMRDDDFLDDDDSDDDDDFHDHTSSPSSSPQHAQSYDYVSDDEFVTDAGIHNQYMCIRPYISPSVIAIILIIVYYYYYYYYYILFVYYYKLGHSYRLLILFDDWGRFHILCRFWWQRKYLKRTTS